MTMDLYVHATDESQKEGMELFEQELAKVVLDEKHIEQKYKKILHNLWCKNGVILLLNGVSIIRNH